MNLVPFIILENVCFYDHLENEATDSGNLVGPKIMVGNENHPLPTLMKCQKECDSNVKCNNVKFCAKWNQNDQVWKLTCFLYDKVITKFAAQYADNSIRTQEYNCSTKFKTCPGGIYYKLIIFIGSHIFHLYQCRIY